MLKSEVGVWAYGRYISGIGGRARPVWRTSPTIPTMRVQPTASGPPVTLTRWLRGSTPGQNSCAMAWLMIVTGSLDAPS